MTKTDYLLTKMAEECSEIAVRCSKAQCFGLGEMEPGQQKTNATRIMDELHDFHAALEMLVSHLAWLGAPDSDSQPPGAAGALLHVLAEELQFNPGSSGYNAAVNAKQAKLEKFMEYSRRQGLLTDEHRKEPPYGCTRETDS